MSADRSGDHDEDACKHVTAGKVAGSGVEEDDGPQHNHHDAYGRPLGRGVGPAIEVGKTDYAENSAQYKKASPQKQNRDENSTRAQ